GGLGADSQAPRLVVGAVAGARHLAVLAAAGHPGLDVVLAIRRSPEIARGDIEHAIGEPEPLKDLLLDGEEPRMHGLADLEVAEREREQLDLRELVHAVEATRLLAGRAGLGTKAV